MTTDVSVTPDRLADQVRQAEYLCDLDRYDEAERILRAVLAADPAHYDATRLLSYLLREQKHYEESRQVAERLIAANPDRQAGYLQMGWTLRAMGRDHDAEPYARRAVELAPQGPVGYRLLAEVLGTLKGRGEEALAAAEEALRLDPDSASAYVALATVQVNLRRWAQAEVTMAEALAREPLDAAYRMKIALVRTQLKKYAAARDDFAAALREDPCRQYLEIVIDTTVSNGSPQEFAGLYQLASAALGRPDLTRLDLTDVDPRTRELQVEVVNRLRTAGEHGRARALVETILAAEPGHQEARSLLADILKDDGRLEEALVLAVLLRSEGYDTVGLYKTLVYSRYKTGAIEKAVIDAREARARHPEVPNFPWFEATLLLKLKRHQEAVEPARRAVALDPDFNMGQFLLGRALYLADQHEEATEALRTAFVQYPDHADAAFLLGLCLWEKKEFGEAEEVARRLIELEPDTARGHKTLAKVLRELADRDDETHHACERALAFEPDDEEVNFWLGMVHVNAERFVEAERYFDRSCAVKPDSTPFLQLRGIARLVIGRFDEATADLEAAMAAPSRNTYSSIASMLEVMGVPDRFAPLYARVCTAMDRRPVDRESPEVLEKRAKFADRLRTYGAHAQADELSPSVPADPLPHQRVPHP